MDPTSRGGQGDAHGGAGHGHSHGHAHGHDHGHGHGHAHGHAHAHSHDHDHGHAHGKAPASIPSRPAGLDRATAFSSSAALRMAVAGGASVLLWAAVWWALAR